jgi:histidinol-phosphate aminotransferase
MKPTDFNETVRKGIPELRPYIPGKPLEAVQQEYGLEHVVKLASNECPFPPLAEAIEAVMAGAEAVRRYPDGYCRKLRGVLSGKLQIPEESILFGNGAEECIRLVAQTVLNPDENAIMPKSFFDAYETATLLTGASARFVPLKDFAIDLEATLAAVDEKTKLVWLCSPANPTGPIITREQLDGFLARLPQGVFVVFDEAYREFVTSTDAARAEEYLEKDPRVIGLRTFSKAYGMAGLRIGYIVAHPGIIDLVAKVKLPFNVNIFAQSLALYHLENPEFATLHVATILSERERMTGEFSKRGMSTVPSEANFLLVELPVLVNDLKPKLLSRGYIIRPGSIWGFDRHMRYSLGSPEQNTAFLETFDDILGANV